MGNSQQLASNAETLKTRDESRHGVTRARDNRVLRPIQRGDRNIRTAALLDRRRHGRFVRENGGHGAVPRQGLHETRTFDEQPKRLLQRVHACAIGRRKLADAVSQHDVGNDAPGSPQRDEAGLHREQRRLRVGGFVDQGRIRVVAEEHVSERPAQAVAHDLGAAIDFLAKYRLMAIKLRPHSRVLRRLPGEQKGQPALSGRSRRGAVGRCRGERFSQLFLRADNRGKTHGKMRSAAVLVKQMSDNGACSCASHVR